MVCSTCLMMCDHAMCGDRGIGECFGVELDLPGTIAKGDPTCQLRYIRREGTASVPVQKKDNALSGIVSRIRGRR